MTNARKEQNYCKKVKYNLHINKNIHNIHHKSEKKKKKTQQRKIQVLV